MTSQDSWLFLKYKQQECLTKILATLSLTRLNVVGDKEGMALDGWDAGMLPRGWSRRLGVGRALC